MRKREELWNGCVAKAGDDEMIFALLERDPAAPATIRFWIVKRIEMRLNSPGDAKLIDAEQCAQVIEASLARKNPAVTIRYTNHRGETADRTVIPMGVRHGASEWHPEPQWLLTAFDVGKDAMRTFAVRDILSWHPEGQPNPGPRGVAVFGTLQVVDEQRIPPSHPCPKCGGKAWNEIDPPRCVSCGYREWPEGLGEYEILEKISAERSADS